MRHSRPLGGEGRCYGLTDLPPGPGLGPDAARADAGLPALDRIVTSPLRRAVALAAEIGRRRGLVPTPDARLREIDFGTWENRSWDDIPRAELDLWAADLLGACPHGGERVRDLAARVGSALRDLPDGGTTLVVTHAGVARAALAQAGHPDPWNQRLDFGAWLTL